MKEFIEKNRVNIIIENRARNLKINDYFNEETIIFLKKMHNYYNILKSKRECSINDLKLYEKLLEDIDDELYKIIRDIKNAIANMKKGIYINEDI